MDDKLSKYKEIFGEDFDPEDYGFDPENLPDPDMLGLYGLGGLGVPDLSAFGLPDYSSMDFSALANAANPMEAMGFDFDNMDLSQFTGVDVSALPSGGDPDLSGIDFSQFSPRDLSAIYGVDFSGLGMGGDDFDMSRFFGDDDEDDEEGFDDMVAGLMGEMIENGKEPEETFLYNPDAEPLTPGHMAALNVAAVNSQENQYYLDSLTTGADPEFLKVNLEEAYDITDTQSALDILNWLAEEGHRVHFDSFKGVFADPTLPVYTEDMDDEDIEITQAHISNLAGAASALIADDFIQSGRDYVNKDITAWDMGRLVNLSRACYDLGYIDRDTAWGYIEAAYRLCKEVYATWKELAIGYTIGSAMVRGAGMLLAGTIYMAEELVLDEDSPYNKAAF